MTYFDLGCWGKAVGTTGGVCVWRGEYTPVRLYNKYVRKKRMPFRYSAWRLEGSTGTKNSTPPLQGREGEKNQACEREASKILGKEEIEKINRKRGELELTADVPDCIPV